MEKSPNQSNKGEPQDEKPVPQKRKRLATTLTIETDTPTPRVIHRDPKLITR